MQILLYSTIITMLKALMTEKISGISPKRKKETVEFHANVVSDNVVTCDN